MDPSQACSLEHDDAGGAEFPVPVPLLCVGVMMSQAPNVFVTSPSQQYQEEEQLQNSEYGSDIDSEIAPPSDYGSDFDAEEEDIIGDLLLRITRQAPPLRERTIVYEEEDVGFKGLRGLQVEREGESKDGPRVLLHSSPPSAVVRVRKGVAVEFGGEYANEGAGSRSGSAMEVYGDDKAQGDQLGMKSWEMSLLAASSLTC